MPRFERDVAGGGGQQADRHAAGVGRSPERMSASQFRREVQISPRGRAAQASAF